MSDQNFPANEPNPVERVAGSGHALSPGERGVHGRTLLLPTLFVPLVVALLIAVYGFYLRW